MFFTGYVWLNHEFHVVVSESVSIHQKTMDQLKAQGGTIISNKCRQNVLGSVIVNGKKSVWPLTKSEGVESDV